MSRVRKIPQRTCIGCRSVRPKKELVRIVRTPEGSIEIDPTGKRSGRGAYICPSNDCLEKAMKGKVLGSALHTSIPDEVLEQLRHGLRNSTEARSAARFCWPNS